MTKSRREVYSRGWFDREIKIDKRLRRKEYNRKIRHAKIDNDMTGKACYNLRHLSWNTMS